MSISLSRLHEPAVCSGCERHPSATEAVSDQGANDSLDDGQDDGFVGGPAHNFISAGGQEDNFAADVVRAAINNIGASDAKARDYGPTIRKLPYEELLLKRDPGADQERVTLRKAANDKLDALLMCLKYGWRYHSWVVTMEMIY